VGGSSQWGKLHINQRGGKNDEELSLEEGVRRGGEVHQPYG